MLQRRYLDNIRPEYSRVYRIKDSVVVSASGNAGSRLEAASATTSTEAPPRRRDTPSYAVLTAHSSSCGGAGTASTAALCVILACLAVAAIFGISSA